jgi:UV DNA damage endonuclease
MEPAITALAQQPRLGLVCITTGPEVRYKTITRARFLTLSPPSQESTLRELYRENLLRLFNAITFCRNNGIGLYRATSNLFPLNDEPAGTRELEALSPKMASFGPTAKRFDVRVLLHPDQFVVLNSETESINDQSVHILERHAHVFDLLGLPQTSWAAFILHGGKGGRPGQLVAAIHELPPSIRNRIVLENDEYAYSAAEILEICQRAGVPMVFDLHHHVIKEALGTYDHPSITTLLSEAAKTWPDPAWQIVHLSNGASAFADPDHSELIRDFPPALWMTPWVEIEAKGKEKAIAGLRQKFPDLR